MPQPRSGLGSLEEEAEESVEEPVVAPVVVFRVSGLPAVVR
jgi:hypothetical protein